MRGLTRLQRRVIEAVLAAAEPHGFALAGGAGLVVAGLSPRPTEDIDAFSSSVQDLRPAAEDVIGALENEGYEVTRHRFEPFLARILVTAGAARRRRIVKIELAREYFEWPTMTTRVGRVLSERELAANKALALFSRTAPRDLCDIATLSSQGDLEAIMTDAKVKDPGFSRPILAEMVSMVVEIPDADWPPDVDIDAVRTFASRLIKAIEAGESLHGFRPDTPIWPADW